MVHLKLVAGRTHTTIDDEQGEELLGWTSIEERNRHGSSPRSSGTLFLDGQAVAFFDRTARYYSLVETSTKLPGHPRGGQGRFVTLLEAIRCYEAHGSFLIAGQEQRKVGDA